MRPLALLLLAALVLPACDTGGGTELPEEELDPIAVLVRYRVSVSGTANDIGVTYTNELGDPVSLGVDFSRAASFTEEITVPPGEEGTFEIRAAGIVTDGNLTVTATALRSDDEEILASDTQTKTATGTEDLSASAPVQVTVILERPPETTL